MPAFATIKSLLKVYFIKVILLLKLCLNDYRNLCFCQDLDLLGMAFRGTHGSRRINHLREVHRYNKCDLSLVGVFTN